MTASDTALHLSAPVPLVGAVESMLPDAQAARSLVRRSTRATLCTTTPVHYPYGSLVVYADLGDGAPVLCLSSLAEHTRNARLDRRASLMVAHDDARVDPLALERVTLVGSLEPCTPDDGMLGAFVDAHPGAAAYVEFPDCSWWRLDVFAARYIGGFGRMSWVDRDDYVRAAPDPLAVHTERIRAHLDGDHADVLADYARHLLGLEGVVSARTLGVDRHGLTILVDTERHGQVVGRVAFAEAAPDLGALRAATVALARRARPT